MRIGVDVGGTKIEAAAMDTAGELVVRERVPTPANDYPAAVETIATLVEEVESRNWTPLFAGIRNSRRDLASDWTGEERI